jgi:hypothetical protein
MVNHSLGDTIKKDEFFKTGKDNDLNVFKSEGVINYFS